MIVFKIFVISVVTILISKLSSAGEILTSMTLSAISSFELSTTFSEASLSVPISSGISSLSEATSGVSVFAVTSALMTTSWRSSLKSPSKEISPSLLECSEQLSSKMISSGISSSEWLSSLLVTSLIYYANTHVQKQKHIIIIQLECMKGGVTSFDNYICVD